MIANLGSLLDWIKNQSRHYDASVRDFLGEIS